MKNFKGLITVLMFYISTVGAISQTYELTGTVKDDIGEYLPGVNIVIKGTTMGVLSDIDGKFSLKVSNGDVLTVSFIGMDKQDIPITGQRHIDVILGTNVELMNEVMVVAYGTSTKEAFTGAATVIDNETMAKQPVANVQQALQGKAANVLVVSGSGQPGTSGSVRIRGVGSMTASSAPLYVVDGVASNNSASNINPLDIESITVLKDASATSLYGSRGANGVILITTKKGKGEDGSIRFSSKMGVKTRTSDGYEIMDAEQYYKHAWLGLYNEGIYTNELSNSKASEYASSEILKTTAFNPYSIDQPFNSDGSITSNAVLLYSEDWRDAIYQTGVMQDYSLVATGSSDNSAYYVGLGYYDETGIVIGTDFTRYNLTANFDKTVKEWFKIRSNNSLTYSEDNTVPSGGEAANPVRAGELFNPTVPIYDDNDDYNWDNNTSLDFNPVGLVNSDIYSSNSMTLASSLVSEIDLPFGIKYIATGGVNFVSGESTTYYNPYHGNGAGVGGRNTQTTIKNLSLSITNLLSWNKEIEAHSLGAMMGHEGRFEEYSYLSGEAINGLVPGNTSMDNFSTPTGLSSAIDPWSMLSYFCQATYDYNDKYYASASLRSDGSSRFGEKKRWGAFYSLGGAWRISQEDFFDVSWIDNLKLRVSYGTTGNNSIGNNTWEALYSLGANYDSQTGVVPMQLQNSYLTWETASKANIAVEATLFDDLYLTLEVYDNTSSKLLLDKPYAPSRGYTSSMSNLGSMSNKGVEFSADYNIINLDKFNWTLGFNISSNINEITQLTQDQVLYTTKRWVVGKSLYNYYMRDWAGVDPSNGKPMWYTNAQESDLAGTDEPTSAYTDPLGSGRSVTNEYSDAERIDLGSSLPKVTGSLNNGVTYGGFSFDFSFYYSLGGKVYNNDYAGSMHDGIAAANNMSIDALDAWTTPGQITDVPRYISNNLDNGQLTSSRFLEDASYVRLKTITLSYNLPTSLLSRTFFSSVQIYVSGDNLLTFTDYKGFDPEVGLNGVTGYNIPTTKTTVLGLNVNF